MGVKRTARARRAGPARDRSGEPATRGARAAGGRDRWPVVLALALALVVGVAQAWMARDLVTLPSALYGGDYAYQMGCIRSIAATGDPMASCSACGANPGYLPLYGSIVALAARTGHVEVTRAMFGMSVVLRALSILVVFGVFAALFGGPVGLVMACLWAALNPALLLKYTEFTGAIVVPLYALALVRALEQPGAGRFLMLGLVLAVAGYAHAVAFAGGLAIAVVALLAAAVWRGRREHRMARELRSAAMALAIVLACSLLALGYWWRPLVVHHGRTSPYYTEWNGGAALTTLAQRLAYTGGQLRTMLTFDSAAHAALSLLVLAGLVAVALGRATPTAGWGVLVTGVTFLWLLHPFVTEPLLHTHFVPDYVRRLLWDFMVLFLAVVPVVLAFRAIGRMGPAGGRAVQILVLVLSVVALAGETGALAASPELVRARQPYPAALVAMQRWALDHTAPNDIVLSTNELSFAWSALTGRKCLVTRRAQNDAYLDMDERNRDAALILYGRDDALRRQRLHRWGIAYLLWTDGWAPSEWQRDPAGGTIRIDPLLWFRDDSAAAVLERAGVRTVDVHDWVDPTLRGEGYRAFDLTCVTADNYQAMDHPWRPELDTLLAEAWSFRVGGRRVAALYRVKS